MNKKTIVAMMLVYGIARGVVDDIKTTEGNEAVSTDTTVFNEMMKAFFAKEGNNGK